MRFLTVLVTTFVMAAMAFESARASYSRINSYLTSHVPNNDEIGPNLKAAANWLKQQEGKRFSFLSSAPVHDLKKFTALQQVVDDTDCDEVAYGIMLSNEQAVGLYGVVTDRILIRQVDKVILRVFMDHAERCQKIYPIKYRQKSKQLDHDLVKRVSNLANTLMEYDRFDVEELSFYQPENLFHQYIKHWFSIRHYIGTSILKTALILNAKEVTDPDVKYLEIPEELRTLVDCDVNKDKIRELAQKYLFGPCRRYVSEFGPDLFAPASLDSEFYTAFKGSDLDYYFGWVNFSICLELSRHERLVLDDIINSYKKEISAIKINSI